MLLEDGGGLQEGVLRGDAAIGPDLEDELVVVRALADAGILDGGEKMESMGMTPMG